MPPIASEKDELRQCILSLLMERYRNRTRPEQEDMFLATTILYSSTRTLEQLQEQKRCLEWEKWDKMYNYPVYWMAKMEMVRLWTSDPARGLVRCAICGRETKWPEAHHLYLSRRFKSAATDVRNIVPACSMLDSPECHARRVHGLGKKEAANRHYRILGHSDPHMGRQIVIDAAKEWVICKVEIPEVEEKE